MPLPVLRRCLARVVLALCVIAPVVSAEEQGSTVRGRLVRRTARGEVPAQGIPVSVNRGGRRSGYAYSGQDGMYYLYNIAAGSYSLEVWAYPNRPPLVFTINVNAQGYTDISPIVVP
jgi:hypothetical protein